MIFSEEQQRRLGELGATSEDLQAGFADSTERNRAFQRLESRLVTEQHERLDALCEGPRRPFILELEERLSAVLRTAGFLQVHTPIILSRARLEKMGVFDGSIMEKQVFWIDSKRCLRPMLAPHLYEYMREVGRLRPRPVRLFEVGPCFRRETQGQRHANEFTMLNLVEMGLPEGTDLNARLCELGAMVLDAAGIEGWRMTDEDSAVYGETSDFVDKNGMELRPPPLARTRLMRLGASWRTGWASASALSASRWPRPGKARWRKPDGASPIFTGYGYGYESSKMPASDG